MDFNGSWSHQLWPGFRKKKELLDKNGKAAVHQMNYM